MFSFNIQHLWIAFLLLGVNSLLYANTAVPNSLIEIQKPVLMDSIVTNVIHTDQLYVAIGENTKTQTPLILISRDGKKEKIGLLSL